MKIETRTLKIGLVLAAGLVGCDSSYGRESSVVGPSEAEIAVHIYHESRGNDDAVGDKSTPFWAYGPLQIRQPCVDDVNRYFGTRYRATQCRGNRALSIKIAKLYWAIYATKAKLGHEPTPTDRAGIWNGGPKGANSWRTAKYRRDFQKMWRER